MTQMAFELLDKKTKAEYEIITSIQGKGKIVQIPSGQPPAGSGNKTPKENTGASEEDKAKRKAIVKSGDKLFEEGDFDGALKAYEKGNKLSPYVGLTKKIKDTKEAIVLKAKEAEQSANENKTPKENTGASEETSNEGKKEAAEKWLKETEINEETDYQLKVDMLEDILGPGSIAELESKENAVITEKLFEIKKGFNE